MFRTSSLDITEPSGRTVHSESEPPLSKQTEDQLCGRSHIIRCGRSHRNALIKRTKVGSTCKSSRRCLMRLNVLKADENA